MNQSTFTVGQFKNRSGAVSWRVEGRLHGLRIRKNFKTREEAAAERATLELKALQTATGLRSTATSLSEEQIREAEALFQRVVGKPRPLSYYVDFALTHYREPEQQKPLADAIADYVAANRAQPISNARAIKVILTKDELFFISKELARISRIARSREAGHRFST